MANHKSQHFVPRCHFRPFTQNCEGKAINLFNISSERFVFCAPVRGQCAKDYFYGADLVVEKFLQGMEGKYASVVRRITKFRAEDADLNFLRSFAYLQYLRTDLAIKRVRQMRYGSLNAAYEETGVEKPEIDLTDHSMMVISLKTLFDTRGLVRDLKVCLLRNESSVEFITSDNPAVLSNRFYAQKLRAYKFGVGSTGTCMFLPLSPELHLMCYDAGAYTIAGKSGYEARIKNRFDIDAINELQFLSADQNIYFLSKGVCDPILEGCRSAHKSRLTELVSFQTFVPSTPSVTGERFRSASREDIKASPRRIIMFSTLHRKPANWPKFLRFRDPIKTYFDGSAAGHLRAAVVPIMLARSLARNARD